MSVAASVHAQSYRIDVRPDTPSVTSVEAGSIATVRFRVSNRGHDARFEERVDVPPNGQVVSRGSAFPLAEGETTVRTVKIVIPEGARAGNYAIDCGVHDSQLPEIRSAAKISVQVLASGKAWKGNAGAAETLLLEARVNEKPLTGIIFAQRLGDGRLVVPADVWDEAWLRPAGEPIALPDGRRGYALESAPGGYGAMIETVVFNSWGSLLASFAYRHDDDTRKFTRADTYWRVRATRAVVDQRPTSRCRCSG